MKPVPPINTAAKVTAAREYLGLDKAALARALRFGPKGRETVRRWEQGHKIPGTAQIALEHLLERREHQHVL